MSDLWSRDRVFTTSQSDRQTRRMGKAAAAGKPATLCSKCAAIPLGIFVPKTVPRSKPLPRSFLTDPRADREFEIDLKELGHSSSRYVLDDTKEARYQHFEGEDALNTLKSASDEGCLLCSTLLFSLEVQRHIRPSARGTWDDLVMPERWPTESGVTLHSLDNSHFIVRDNHARWSLVRFGAGDLVNEKGSLLHDKANDGAVFALIEGWMSQCNENHNSCTLYRINSEPGYIPARLIQVEYQESNEETAVPRISSRTTSRRSDMMVDPKSFKLTLVERDGIPPSERNYIEYIALSHCWGQDQTGIPRTTKENRVSRKNGIPWDELTTTFKDAMEIAWKLEKPYIWIDSLCIVQDDDTDLEVHCASMSQVYSNAFCTVAATGAVDGTQGCFMERSSNPQRPCVINPVVTLSLEKQVSMMPPRTRESSQHLSEAFSVKRSGKPNQNNEEPSNKLLMKTLQDTTKSPVNASPYPDEDPISYDELFGRQHLGNGPDQPFPRLSNYQMASTKVEDTISHSVVTDESNTEDTSALAAQSNQPFEYHPPASTELLVKANQPYVACLGNDVQDSELEEMCIEEDQEDNEDEEDEDDEQTEDEKEDREWELYQAAQIGFTVLPTFKEWTHSLKGPLLSRGWTLQERELSCRVLHFTADRVVWECRETYASEDDSQLETKSMVQDIGLKFRLLDGTVRDRKDRPYDYKFSKWLNLVEEYSSRQLSIPADKLRAIAGLAEAIRTIQRDDIYLSGLWKRDLLRQLMWQPITTSNRIAYCSDCWPPAPVAEGIPSWSWAAYDGPVVFHRDTWVSEVSKASPSTITLYRPAMQISISEESLDTHSLAGGKLYQVRDARTGCELRITFDVDPAQLPEMLVQCVMMGSLKRCPADAQNYLPGYLESSSHPANAMVEPPNYSGTGNVGKGHLATPFAENASAIGLVLIPSHHKAEPIRYRRVGAFQAFGEGSFKGVESASFEIV